MSKLSSHQKIKSLQIRKQYSLCFEYCDIDNIPTDKKDVQIVIKALQAFSNIQLLESQRHPHKLDPAGKSEYIKSLYNKHKQDIQSIDAGKRHSKHGDKRIIFCKDETRENVVKILSLFFDDHGKK